MVDEPFTERFSILTGLTHSYASKRVREFGTGAQGIAGTLLRAYAEAGAPVTALWSRPGRWAWELH